MTTLEKARKFYRRIMHWSGWALPCHPSIHNGEFEEWIVPALWCQARVARTLIRQERHKAKTQALLTHHNYLSGYWDGLHDALAIIDAVYGK